MRGTQDASRNSRDVDEDGFCLLWIVFDAQFLLRAREAPPTSA
jgi:hypothetical protein